MASDGTADDCVFLVKEDKNMINVSNRVLTNTPSRIVLRIPSNLEVGKYHLLIYTFHSEQKGKKEIYCQYVEYDNLLWVKV